MLTALIVSLFACESGDTTEADDTANANTTLVIDTDDDAIADTDATDTDTVGTALPGDATIWDVCGPTDGDALFLSVAQADAECATDGSNPRNAHPISLFLWAAPPTADALPYTMGIGTDFDAGGNASYSPTPSGPTYLASTGSVTFTSFTAGTSAAGTWTITLDDGTVLYGDFDAAWCANEPVCR